MTVTGGTALNATTSGTFTVTGAANTLSSTTGAALNVANVTIGAGGLTFQSISASGGTSGIILNGTGAGFFTVTGNSSGNGGGTITLNAPGTAATFTAPVLADLTGGTIQNSTGVGISLTNVGTVSLTRMQVRNSGTDGISLSGATGFTLDHSFVTDNTGAITHEGMRLSNCSGTMNITNSTVGPAAHDCILLDNLNVNMAAFNLTSSVIQDTRSIGTANGFLGNDGLLIQMRGTSVLTSGQVTGCVFTNDFGTGLHVLTSETARIGSASAGVITAPAASNSFTVQTSTFTSNGVGVDISQNDTSNEAFQILNNTVIGRLTAPNAVASSSSPTAINTFTAAGASTGPASHFHVGKIDGNFIGTQGVKDSGSGFGNGIRAVVQGGNTQGVVAISNNTVREVPNQTVINIIGQNGAGVTGTGTARFKVTGNTMPQVTGSNLSLGGPANTAIAEAGIFVLADEDFIVTTVITGNTIYDVTTMSGTFDIYFAQRDGPPANSQLRTEGTGSVSAFILGNNTLAGGSKFIDEGAGSGNPTALVAPGSAGAYPLLVAPGGVERSAARMALADTGDTLSVAKGAKTWVKVAIPVTERAIPPVGKPVPSAVGTMPAPAITQSDLDATVSAALARWEAAGLTGGQVARLRALRFEAATLSDLHLGEADGALIRVDGNAGDNGWFIDPTPLDDAEFASHITGPRRYTDPDGAPAGRMDLLTAILHEMGHALGLDDTYLETHRDALMYGFLTKGERRLPTHRDAVAAAMLGAVPHAHAHFLSAPLTIGTLPPGKMVTVKYAVTITGAVPSISNQGTVSGSNFANVLTDDPTVGGAADATVTPVELPPTVSNVAVSTNEDTTLTFTAANFTGSYSDPNGDALATVRITSLPANGVLKNGAAVVAAVPADLALASIGSLTYVPNANVSGADSFGWNGADGTLFATTGATVNINVIAVNDAPVLAGIESVALPYTENAAATAITGTLTVADIDSPNLASATVQITGGYANGQDLLEFTNQLGITGVFTPATGLMTLSGSASPGNYQTALRAVTYRNPSDNPLTSPRTVTFRVDDGGSPNNLSSPVTRNIAVTAVNDAPVITGQNPVATPEDTARAIGFADLLVTDPDNAYPAAFTLTVANGTNYTHVGNTITPASNFNGVLTVPVTVNDGTANSNSFNLQVTVTPVNDNPVAGPDSIERYPTQSTKVKVTALLANDSDPDGDTPLAITAVGAPASGLASVSLGGGYVFYTPNAGFTAADTFTYTLADGHGGTAIGTVTVTIHADALPAQNVMKMELLGNGSARISFAAIPGRTYRVQSIDNLASVNWVDRFTGAADAQGLLQFTDPPPLPPQRFYRTITP